jgi:hypothetical protein
MAGKRGSGCASARVWGGRREAEAAVARGPLCGGRAVPVDPARKERATHRTRRSSAFLSIICHPIVIVGDAVSPLLAGVVAHAVCNYNGIRWADAVLVQRRQKQLFCEPNNGVLDDPELTEMLRRQLNADPKFGAVPIGFGILIVLQITYPCT